MGMRLAATWSACLLAAAAPCKAQGGYREAAVPDVGLTYQCPRDYDAIPTEPTEEWVIAQWAEQVPKDPRKHKRVRPQLRIVWIDRKPPQVAMPAGDAPPPSDGAEGAAPAPTPAPAAAAIDSTQVYLARELAPWTVWTSTPEKARDGSSAQISVLVHPATKDQGWLYEHSDAQRICLFVGFCGEEDAQEQVKIWTTMARSARFGAPKPLDLSRWERFYEKNPRFVDPAYRLEARSKLVRGWQADDTENYIFVYSTKDVKLLEVMKRELEAIREEYMRLFPPVRPITAVSTVRICKSQDEYFQYGGPQGSGGYWNWNQAELVFFDYDSLDQAGRKKKGTANSRIVLYHEAFHQFIHYSAGELPPHSWFNEGTGDYFSGARISGGKVRGIGVNPWRIALIQRGIREGKTVPWEKLLRFEQPEFYNPLVRGMCYAQAWSLIHFLRESRVAQKHPQWSRINPVYFDTLKAAYAEELAKPAPAPVDGKPVDARAAAGLAARKRAVEAAFQDVDLKELDREWREFVLALSPPQ